MNSQVLHVCAGDLTDSGSARVIAHARRPGVRLTHARQGLGQGVRWALPAAGRDEHTVIIHLAGRIDELHTEIVGVGRRGTTAQPGDVWCVPAGFSYAARAHGGDVEFAEIGLTGGPGLTGLPTWTGDRGQMSEPGQTGKPGRMSELGRTGGPGQSGWTGGLAPRLAYPDGLLHQAVIRILDRAAIASETDESRWDTEQLWRVVVSHVTRTYRPASRRRERTVPRLASATAARVTDFVADHLDDQISVRDLASVAGQSIHEFRPRFVESFGVTPGQFVLERRMELARALLLSTDDDIAAVAHRAGFASHSHLTETFHRRIGLSPSDFRSLFTS